ncbi:hypothetical protein BDZ97DRAFT_1345960 [Flammula alnicola]|nr:hypothetical protein BDZ97DRAFT_1345960 [Flammula alnicola]
MAIQTFTPAETDSIFALIQTTILTNQKGTLLEPVELQTQTQTPSYHILNAIECWTTPSGPPSHPTNPIQPNPSTPPTPPTQHPPTNAQHQPKTPTPRSTNARASQYPKRGAAATRRDAGAGFAWCGVVWRGEARRSEEAEAEDARRREGGGDKAEGGRRRQGGGPTRGGEEPMSCDAELARRTMRGDGGHGTASCRSVGRTWRVRARRQWRRKSRAGRCVGRRPCESNGEGAGEKSKGPKA